MATKIRIF